MAPHSKPVESDNESESDAGSDVTEIFSDNGPESESNSDLGLDSEDSDDDNDDNDDDADDDCFNDEGQLSPEHYLAQAENLDVSQLRQKRYSDKTQEALDDTRMYWNR